jgi:hypothetical protein
VGQLASHGVSWDALTAASTAPPVQLDDSAREYSTVGFKPLTGGFEAEFVEPGERGQVGIGEGVKQVGCAWLAATFESPAAG